MHTRTAILALSAAAAALAGCRSVGNDRNGLGDPSSPAGTTLSAIHGAGARDETPRSDDAPSLAGLTRASWARQTVSVPVEGTYAFRRYSRNYQITETTSRQRGDFPTPLSTLELTGETQNDQLLETLVSGPYAFYEGVTLVPRFFFVRPCEEVRATPTPHWRAPVNTPRYPQDERIPSNQARADDPAAAPH